MPPSFPRARLGLKSKDWPYAVIDFYLGLRSLDEMRAAADWPTAKCKADYTGAWHLLRGSNAEARTALQVAADTCPKTYVEYTAAVAELKRLKQPPAGAPSVVGYDTNSD